MRNAVASFIWTTKRDDVDFKFLRKVRSEFMEKIEMGPPGCKVTYKKNYVVIHTFPQKGASFEIPAVLISFLNV